MTRHHLSILNEPNHDLTPDATHLTAPSRAAPSPAPSNEAPPASIHPDDPEATPITSLDSSSNIVTPPSDTSGDKAVANVLQLALDIEVIKSKLQTKDMEIELLNDEIKLAYGTISTLQRHVNDLEQRLNSSAEERSERTNSSSSPSHCLLPGDTNFRRI